ncbi:LysR family transcriptional regulator [Duganella sp. Dugasp56]|uniref:LysR family transcriptional regulator n=1 Tax=Duganella sp. Dugasp56 TaxID=3243046 RepID=UPI0039AF79F7
MDRLTLAKVFIEIVDRGSLTAAANSLEISRSMASRYLDELEDWLGARLLHRTTRKISLSNAGEQALPRLREMLDLASDVQSIASRHTQEVQGRLRITTSTAFAEAQLAHALVDFQQLHPGVEVDLIVLDRTINLVEERVDLAIRLSNHVDPGIIARRLAVCRSVLCATPAYLQRQGHPTDVNDLRSHRCVLHNGATALNLASLHKGEIHAIPAKGILSCNETSVLRTMVLAGAGIAMLPTFYVGDDLLQGRLELVLPSYELPPIDIQTVYLSRRHQPKPLRLLIQFLVERFGGSVAPWDTKLHKLLGNEAYD